MPQRCVFTAFSCVVFLTLTPSCSSSDSPNPASTTDSGANKDTTSNTDAADGGAGGTVKDRGVVFDYLSGKPVANITLTENGTTATTDDKGAFSLDVPTGKPLELVVTGADTPKTYIGEMILGADVDRKIPIPTLSLFRVGKNSFTDIDPAKALVYLVVRPTGACTDVSGGTITVKSPADAKYEYFTDKLPDAERKEFKFIDPDVPVVAVYNVPVGEQIDVEITHPTCKQIPYPAKVGTETYTGRVTTEGGDANSVLIYYLQ
jgi:hypothetical protein